MSGSFFTPRALHTPQKPPGAAGKGKAKGKGEEAMSKQFIAVCGCVWTALAIGLAMCVDDLGVVFALTGAICGSSVIFICPGFFWYRHGPKSDFWRKGPAYAVWFIGVVVMIMGTAITLKMANRAPL